MIFFTSIVNNYLPKARVLADSVKRHNPNAPFYLILSDDLPEGFEIEKEPFDQVIQIEDLEIPDFNAWVFKHRIVELCTAVKGPAFLKLFDTTDAEIIVYLDPDIIVLHPLDELTDHLKNASIILTPHLTEPEVTDEAIRDNEVCTLKHGIYNLGFLAVKRCDEGLRFLKWWRDRLYQYCYDDIPDGLFTDQRWADLVPAFFSNVLILRDITYNVATWNLNHRPVAVGDNGKLYIEGSPLKFFHFSGYDSGAQKIMLQKYADRNSPLFRLRNHYQKKLKAAGQKQLGKLPCKYAYYTNGKPIEDWHRIVYRTRKDLMKKFSDPAKVKTNEVCFYRWARANAKQAHRYQSDTPQGIFKLRTAMKRFF
jgi:lipopolysaccharide biosynthesis glycosyltransferase